MDDPTQTIPPIPKKKKKKKKRAFENCQIGYEIRKLGLPKNMLWFVNNRERKPRYERQKKKKEKKKKR